MRLFVIQLQIIKLGASPILDTSRLNFDLHYSSCLCFDIPSVTRLIPVSEHKEFPRLLLTYFLSLG